MQTFAHLSRIYYICNINQTAKSNEQGINQSIRDISREVPGVLTCTDPRLSEPVYPPKKRREMLEAAAETFADLINRWDPDFNLCFKKSRGKWKFEK